jgi:hypothetical protein
MDEGGLHDARGKNLGEILPLQAVRAGKKLPLRPDRPITFTAIASDLGPAALAVYALYRDTKDGDVLLVQVGEGIMQGDAQEMGRTGHVRIEQGSGNAIGLVEYLTQVMIRAAFDSAM